VSRNRRLPQQSIRRRELSLNLFRKLAEWVIMREKREGKCECKDLLEHILHEVRSIRHFQQSVKELKISQFSGGFAMPITGVPVGGTGTFQESGLPAGSVFPTGTSFAWTSSDTANTTLTPSTDGTQVAVAVGSGATVGGSTTLSCVATLPGGGTVSGSATVPYLPAAVTVPTSIQIDQLS